MNIANLYRTLKQILNDSNVALVNKGLNEVYNLGDIPLEIERCENINRLPYFLEREIIEVTEDDLDGVITIKDQFFKNCTNLTNISMPDSITKIGISSFENCTNLTNVILSNNLTSIGGNAFSYCESLKTITIPASVTYIASYAFWGRTNLTDVYLYPTTPPTLGNSYTIPNATIHVPVGSGNAYKSATNWSNLSGRIVEDIVIE